MPMVEDLHYYYNQLTPPEKRFVDDSIRSIYSMRTKNYNRISLAGDDRVEKVVNAISLWVIESREAKTNG